jgi:hypothetical protein
VKAHDCGVKSKIKVYGRTYPVRVLRRVIAPSTAPRLVVVAFQPNNTAKEILRLCLDSIHRNTPEDHELWVVDNASPKKISQWLENEPDINVIFNQSKPGPRFNFIRKIVGLSETTYMGSYANAVALELAARIIDADSQLMMTLHMDTMPCSNGWLSYLTGQLDEQVRCVGVRLDTKRVKAVHVLGMLFDFNLFRSLKLTFAHDMPRHDTGDGISLAFENAGYRIWACPNTLWKPELLDCLPADSPYRNIMVDRSFDDQGRVIFLHLGRGILKSHASILGEKTTPEQWLCFGREIVLRG